MIKNLKKLIEDKIKKFKEFLPALTASFLVIILSILITNLSYHPKKDLKRGYEIKLAADGSIIKPKPKPQIDFASAFKIADAKKGEKIFRKCSSCHSAEKNGGNKVGPNLYSVVNRKTASISGFSYSDALMNKGGNWSRTNLNQFLEKPREYIKGTKMAFVGLRKTQDRADVIKYLEQNAK